MPTIKRISVKHLEIGMYIADISNEWIPDTNLKRHGMIKRREAIEQILKLGVSDVYIDTAKGLDSPHGVMAVELDQRYNEQLQEIQKLTSQQKTPSEVVQDENSPAARIHRDAIGLVSRIMDDVKMGSVLKLQPVEDMADSITESIRRNQSALSCFTRLRSQDEYLIEHSFSVAVLIGILARSMGFNNDDLHQIIVGGFLHDIGKVRVPESILYKPGTLTPVEWDEMKRHVVYGEKALIETPGVPLIAKQICAQHHERIDGSGYPRGLSAGAIELHGRMGAVVDVYDAITADRCYHKAILPTVAMKKLLEWSENHLDREITYQFIACMSIYPAGSAVELSDNKIAMVIEANPRKQHQPVVKVVYDKDEEKLIAPYTVNLAFSGTEEKIVAAVNPNDFGIPVEKYL